MDNDVYLWLTVNTLCKPNDVLTQKLENTLLKIFNFEIEV